MRRGAKKRRTSRVTDGLTSGVGGIWMMTPTRGEDLLSDAMRDEELSHSDDSTGGFLDHHHIGGRLSGSHQRYRSITYVVG